MAARIFLWIVAVLTLLVVAGAFVFYQFGDRILAEQAMPKVEFKAPPPEARPTYASIDAWWSRPDMDEPLADWEPDAENVESVEIDAPVEGDSETGTQVEDEIEIPPPVALPPLGPERAAATFYIHPTTYLKTDRWNADMELTGIAETRARLFVQSQASTFADVSKVWAPRYRQASFGTFLSQSANAQAALDVAYGDISEAFTVFLEENPEGPIIVAGHSQGGLHALRLLTERRGEIADRLVAAYVVGWPVDAEADLPATGLPACTSREEARCMMSWLTFGDPPNPGLVLREWLDAEGYAGIERERDRLVCTNPLTGGEDGEALPADNPGLLVPDATLTSAVLRPGSVGARCDRGLLLLNGEVPELGPFVLPGNNYHVFDYALFWGAIREDVAARLSAWSAQ
ncbi:DUF3089 domain-containing protein [Sphingomicrobium sp. XHP0235]|uniref:DUF3089 domain-containing protein n=1 Tax=Sphingomicrobium aquimarinum TaxID=3133971 RepID=UPI0031FEC75E